MTKPIQGGDVRPGRLVTVAYLKAQLDSGGDHLGIFLPLLLDVLSLVGTESFTTADAQDLLARRHHVAMPQSTVATLLGRATKKGYITRSAGRYSRKLDKPLPASQVSVDKESIEALQRALGERLLQYAAAHGLSISSVDDALDLLLDFLEDEQVGMLLGTQIAGTTTGLGRKQRSIVAGFVAKALRCDPDSTTALRSMLEGLVLYHAAFLPEVGQVSHRFRDLQVLFDSGLVRQALGYEGVAAQTLMRETISVLQAGGVRCVVLDKTVLEIKRILEMYERKLGTAAGRRSLRAVPMARHFLTKAYTPSDVHEMSALLETEVASTGLRIMSAPRREKKLTHGEQSLGARLADPQTRDDTEPRVVHDVDCVAAVLVLRRGHRAARIEDARAVFATSSPLVIKNTRLWWIEDEHENGVEPVVHIRALTNVAWLKKPALAGNLKLAELTALCAAALRPSQATWERFLRHLDALQRSDRINSDDTAAVLISSMSDRLLRDAEVEVEDPTDIDAVTLDEVVRRVQETYAENHRGEVQAIQEDYERRLASLEARAKDAERDADEATASARRRGLALDGRARQWASKVAGVLQWAVGVAVVIAAGASLFAQGFGAGWISRVLAIVVAGVTILELVGALGHVAQQRTRFEAWLFGYIRAWMQGEEHGQVAPPAEETVGRTQIG